jgi:hypothetical protein
MKRLFLLSILVFSFFICVENSGCGPTEKKVNAQPKQLNISILLDLSDRINPLINPDAQKNDIENIHTITEFFKSNMELFDAYNAKGKIRIFFSPPPSNPNINSIVSKLTIDCSKMDNKGRRKVYDNITEDYAQNLEKIYKETIDSSDWDGSDIWRFFKTDVKDYCIERDTNYRNILIIFTDGYLYHKQSLFNDKNRFTYLLGSSNLIQYRKPNFEQLIKTNDFGIMSEQNDLSALEVLVLEIKAENPNNKIDEDILPFLWKKWFNEMKVSHYEAYCSDLPANTKTRITKFLNNN